VNTPESRLVSAVTIAPLRAAIAGPIKKKEHKEKNERKMAAQKDSFVRTTRGEFVLAGFKDGYEMRWRGLSDYRQVKILFGISLAKLR